MPSTLHVVVGKGVIGFLKSLEIVSVPLQGWALKAITIFITYFEGFPPKKYESNAK